MPYDLDNGTVATTFADDYDAPDIDNPCYEKWLRASGTNMDWLGTQRQRNDDTNAGHAQPWTVYDIRGKANRYYKALAEYLNCCTSDGSSPKNKTPIIIAPPPIDLRIDGWELTQATQRWSTQIVFPLVPVFDYPLIERKDLCIRVYLSVGDTPPVASGVQFVGELVIAGLPTQFSVTGPVLGSVVNRDSYVSPPGIPDSNDKNIDQRGNDGQSLIFTVPAEMCIGTLHCTITVYPVGQQDNRVSMNFDAPSDVQRPFPYHPPLPRFLSVPFTNVQPLRIQPVLIRYTGPVTVRFPGGGNRLPLQETFQVDDTATLDDALQALDWVKKVYPISDLPFEAPLQLHWTLDISDPTNLWALRKNVANLRGGANPSIIYVGFISPKVFPPFSFQIPRGIGLESDHGALTVAANGPATAHAIGRALGLLIIDCGAPIPPYAVPSGNFATWAQPVWSWKGGAMTLPGNATSPSWDVQTDPLNDPDTQNLMSGNMTLSMSRSLSRFNPQSWGFDLFLNTEAQATNVLDTQLPPQLLPGVFANPTQKFTCEFTVSEDVQLLVSLSQYTNEKTQLAIFRKRDNAEMWNTDNSPILAGGQGPHSANGVVVDASLKPVVLKQKSPSGAIETYRIESDADVTLQVGASAFTVNLQTVDANTFTQAHMLLVPLNASPISETVPPSGNFPLGSIEEVGLDNQRFWVYDPKTNFDFMSFCDRPWVSPYTYLSLLKKIDAL